MLSWVTLMEAESRGLIPKLIRGYYNLDNIILKIVLENPGISIGKIPQLTGVSRVTIWKRVRDLNGVKLRYEMHGTTKKLYILEMD